MTLLEFPSFKRPEILCAICQEPITVAHIPAEEVHTFRGKDVHADCYYQKLGELIDQHPIVWWELAGLSTFLGFLRSVVGGALFLF